MILIEKSSENALDVEKIFMKIQRDFHVLDIEILLRVTLLYGKQ